MPEPAKYKVVVQFNQFGPYHIARMNGASNYLDITGIEIFEESAEYDWGQQGKSSAQFNWITLFAKKEKPDKNRIFRELQALLDKIKPDAVAINGWSETSAFAALHWCLQNNIPAIAMSESTAWDEERSPYKEWIKKQLVSCFAAGLAGGTPHKEYLAELGIPAQKIFIGYDVIDNNYFMERTAAARNNAESLRAKYNLPTRYFLASNRFIPKKNLFRLLEAYRDYRQVTTAEPWSLVLLGDGSLRPDLENTIRDFGLSAYVKMPGFCQYDELPVYYGLAKAFVHASTSEQWGLVVNEAMASGLPVIVSDKCGCAHDLVKNNQNGYTFNPYDAAELTKKMTNLAAAGTLASEMGARSQAIISEFTPDTFGKGLQQAVQAALKSSADSTFLHKQLIKLLSYK
jgi:1,2-diacylglycerol 3-alpha-glucosyltransferase